MKALSQKGWNIFNILMGCQISKPQVAAAGISSFSSVSVFMILEQNNFLL